MASPTTSSTGALPENLTALIAAAHAAIDAVPRQGPIPKASDHTVGSACLASDGRIFTGVNVFHFTGGPCGENIALGNAIMGGVCSSNSPGFPSPITNEIPTLTHIVAVGFIPPFGSGRRGVINPCGRCRQMLMDYYPNIGVIVEVAAAAPDLGVVGGSGSGGESAGERLVDGGGGFVDQELRVVSMKELLPFAYVLRKWSSDGVTFE